MGTALVAVAYLCSSNKNKTSALWLLVLDNAAYHGKNMEGTPTSQSKKQFLINWLSKNGISFHPKALKAELWALVKQAVTTNPKKRVDELLKTHGHIPLRLPPYHWLNTAFIVFHWYFIESQYTHSQYCPILSQTKHLFTVPHYHVIHCDILSYTVTYSHTLSHSVIHCHILSYTVTFCHPLSNSVIHCHILSYIVTHFIHSVTHCHGHPPSKNAWSHIVSQQMHKYFSLMTLLKPSKNEMFYMDTVDVHYNLHTLLTPYLFVVTSWSHMLNMIASQWFVADSSDHMCLLLCKNYSTSAISI